MISLRESIWRDSAEAPTITPATSTTPSRTTMIETHWPSRSRLMIGSFVPGAATAGGGAPSPFIDLPAAGAAAGGASISLTS